MTYRAPLSDNRFLSRAPFLSHAPFHRDEAARFRQKWLENPVAPIRDSDASPTELVGLIVPVNVGSGRFRLHLTGPRLGIRQVLEELWHLRCLAADEATLLEDLAPILDTHHVVLADVLDVRAPAAPAIPLVDLLRWAAASRTPPRAFAIMEVAFADASHDDLARLISSSDLPWVRDLLESVLTDLDGQEAAARSRIAGLVPEQVARLLIDGVPHDRRNAAQSSLAPAGLAAAARYVRTGSA